MLVDFQRIQEDLCLLKDSVGILTQKLEQLNLATPQDDKPLSVAEVADFFGIAEQTIYQNIKRIPHRKRFGRLYFIKSELMAYLNGKEETHE